MLHSLYGRGSNAPSWLIHRIFYLLALVFPTSVFALNQPLTLNDAIAKTLTQNPQLHQFSLGDARLKAELELSGLKPGYELQVELENFAGTGESGGVDSAELTVSLSSVIELGNKQQSRLAVADAKLFAFEHQRKALTLDILGRLTADFISVLSTQEEIRLASDAVSLAQTLYVTVRNRAKRGAASDAEVSRAKALVARAEIQKDSLQQKLQRQKMALASYWGSTKISFGRVEGSLFAFSKIQPYQNLFERVKTSPALEVLASEVRLKDMEVKLSQSQNRANLSWQFGVRRLQESEDSALTLGFSMPLFSEKRNRSSVEAAMAERHQVDYKRTETIVRLHNLLFSAYSQREQFVGVVRRLQKDVIPNLEQALSVTKSAYDRGRLKYQDWIVAQQELLSAKQQLIVSASAVLLNQALIEQLTSQPLSE
ncbi:MAG: TolC family protein [Pseudomonadales bacterium]|nr:TolC family protein [Pseudomonadales bacterium]